MYYLEEHQVSLKRDYLLLLGSLAIFIMLLFTPPPEGLSQNGWNSIAVATLMLLLWVAECIPVAVTALLPLVLFPLFGIYSIKHAAIPFASPVIFLFIGGFILALAIEKSGLHKIIAHKIIHIFGSRPSNILAGFIFSTAFISLWISNTASTMMMMPIAISVIRAVYQDKEGYVLSVGEKGRFAAALCLAVCYASAVGGIGTIVGTPTNMIAKDFLDQSYGIQITFESWVKVGLPIAIVLAISLWAMLSWKFKLKNLPIMSIDKAIMEGTDDTLKPEMMVGGVFLLMMLAWLGSDYLKHISGMAFTETSVAIVGAILLFMLPSGKNDGKRMLEWKDTTSLPWGIIMLFGGGLSLSAALIDTGVADWLGSKLTDFKGVELLLVVILIAGLVTFISEIISNIAAITTVLPIIGALSNNMEINPLILTIPATFAASLAFMLPSGTPSNAIAYASGYVRIRNMVRVGFVMNIVSILIISVMTYFLIPAVFDTGR